MKNPKYRLVRNRVPEKLTVEQVGYATRRANERESGKFILAKLLEEVTALSNAMAPDQYQDIHVLEELADIIEVCYEIARMHECCASSLANLVEKRLSMDGSFNQHILLMEVE